MILQKRQNTSFRKTRHLFFVLFFFVFIFTVFSAAFAEQVKPPKILILYNPTFAPKSRGVFDLPERAILLTNILGHFKPEVAHAPVEKYFSGMMKNYDFVFYIGDQTNVKVPEVFMEDIPKHPKVTIVWLRWNLDRFLTQHASEYGFRLLPPSSGFVRIAYNNRVYPRPDTEMIPPVQVTDWNHVETSGILQSDSGFTAFSVHAKNLWYFPDVVFYGTPNLIFSDLLHKVFRVQHPVQQKFFVRLEDIHPLRDPGRLRDNCRVLEQAKVPFMLSVIPQYRKPNQSRPVYLKEKPHLVQAIKDCMSWGGSILMHGATHQYHDETGEGHEFWDIHKDQPIAEYTESVVHEKINQGIQALTELGLYPIAWETPHYAASQEIYQIIAQHFSTAVESRQVSNRTYHATQSFPFIVQDIYGQTIIPENVGFINFDAGETIERKLEKAARYKIVQDAVVGVFYHPYYESKYLAKLVEGIKALGFAPFELRDIPSVTLGKNIAIFSGLTEYDLLKPNEKIRTLDGDAKVFKVAMDQEWLHTSLLDYRYRSFDEFWSKEKMGADAVVTIPDKTKSLFLIETASAKPSPISEFRQFAENFIIGKTNSPIETVQRWIIWVLFLGTIIFFIVILKIFITRTSYHSSHFRKED